MSKKYKGKTCAYCAIKKISTSKDHVIAREFFPIDKRAYLPKVPACKDCNNKKSKIETDLTSILPFGANHAGAAQSLSMVPSRLAKNERLHRELASSVKPVWIKKNNLFASTITLSINASQLHDLIRYIVRGLVCYHWHIEIPAHYFIGVATWTEQGEQVVRQYMPTNGKEIVERNYGDGVIEYKGIQASDNPYLTLWRIKLFGGLILGGEDNQISSPHFWAISSPKKFELFQ